MTNEPLLKFDESLALKALGFDVPADHYAHVAPKDIRDWPSEKNWNEQDVYVSIPKAHQAIRWLREIKGVHVQVDYSDDNTRKEWLFYICDIEKHEFVGEGLGINYDHAVLEGIKAAIHYLKSKSN